MRPSLRAPRAAAHLLAAVALATCSDSTAGPPRASAVRLAFAPAFSAGALAAAAELQEAGIAVSSVRIAVNRPGTTDTLLNKLIPVAPGDSSVTLEADVVIRGSEEQLKVSLEFAEAGGTVLYAGQKHIVARQGGSTTTQVPATSIEYVGPGAGAVTLQLAPADTTALTNVPLPLIAVAKDAAGKTISAPLLIWSSSSSALASVSGGVVTPAGPRGEVTITAKVPNGVAGQAKIRLVPPPAMVIAEGGGGQSAPAGSLLAQPFKVRVKASDHLGVPGVKVLFAAATAGGSVSTTTVRTDSAGYASTGATLGTTIGSYVFSATVDGLPAVKIEATATAAAAASLVLAAGSGQSGYVGSTLAPLVVKVTDAYGNPVPNLAVRWQRTQGTGTLSSASTTTDGQGQAQVAYTLGTTAGTETVSATLDDPAVGGVAFSLTALALPPTQLSLLTQPGDTARSGEPIPNAVRVQLMDSTGKAAAKAGITIAARVVRTGEAVGDVTLSGTTSATTDASGVAEFADLALTGLEGTVALTFAADGLAPAQSAGFHLAYGALASLAFWPEAPDTIAIELGQAIPDGLIVETLDAVGNHVPNVPVRFLGRADSATGLVVLDSTLATNAAGELPASAFPLPSAAGVFAVSMSAGEPAVATAGFVLLVRNPPPASLVFGAATAIEAGDRQVRTVGEALLTPLAVQLLDSAGAGVPASGIVWRVWNGSSIATLDTTHTDSSGRTSLLPALSADTASAAHVFEAAAIDAPDLIVRFQAVARPDATYDRVWFGATGASTAGVDWGSEAHWDAGVPTSTSSVLIPRWGSYAASPVLASDVAVGSVRTLGAGSGTLDLAGRTLGVAADLRVSQVIGGGILRMTGSGIASVDAPQATLELAAGAAVTLAAPAHAFAAIVGGALTVPDAQHVKLAGGDFTVGTSGQLQLVGSGSIANARSVLFDANSSGSSGTGTIGFTGDFERRAGSTFVIGPTLTLAASVTDTTTRSIRLDAGSTIGSLVLRGPDAVVGNVRIEAPVAIAGRLDASRVHVTADSLDVAGQLSGDAASRFDGVRMLHSSAAAGPTFAGTAPVTVVLSGDARATAPAKFRNLEVRGIYRLAGNPVTVEGALGVLGTGAAIEMLDTAVTLTVGGPATFAGMNSAEYLRAGKLVLRGDFAQRNPDQLTPDAFRPGADLEVVLSGPAHKLHFDSPATLAVSGSFFTRVRVDAGAVATQVTNVYVGGRLDVRGRWTADDYALGAEAKRLLDMVDGSAMRVDGTGEFSQLNLYGKTVVEVKGSATAQSCYKAGTTIIGTLTCNTESTLPLIGSLVGLLSGSGTVVTYALAAPAELRRRG